jgi:hypothetical protein
MTVEVAEVDAIDMKNALRFPSHEAGQRLIENYQGATHAHQQA